MMMECESVANSYTKYIHSVDSLNARYGNRIRLQLFMIDIFAEE